jgi:methylenetetrahydrofolate dehydrogenase (NADP+) / methenyltetrahydrofolate cyclohydrolase
MPALLFSGHALAEAMLTQFRLAETAQRPLRGRAPSLALLWVGDNPGASAFAARLKQLADDDILVTHQRFPATITVEAFRAALARLNDDPLCDAIVPLLPFPAHLPDRAMCTDIAPAKDVDCLTPSNLGFLTLGPRSDGPCAASAALKVATELYGDLRGACACIVGASRLLGLPLALMLVHSGATVTIAHRDTTDLIAATRTADVLFVAAGSPHLIGARHVKPGAVVIDLGITPAPDGRIVGDVDVAAITDIARAVTLAPDGVGPVTAAMMLAKTARAAFIEPRYDPPNS